MEKKDKSINLIIYEFRQKITEEINNSPLPLSVKSMVLKELFETVSLIAEQQLQQELKSIRNTAESENEKEPIETEV